MGVIQNAMNSMISGVGQGIQTASLAQMSATSRAERERKEHEDQERRDYNDLGNSIYGDALIRAKIEGPQSYNNLISRQQEAMNLVEEYKKAAWSQKEAMQSIYNNYLGGKGTRAGKAVYKQGLRQKEDLMTQYSNKVLELKNKPAGGDK